MKKYIYSALLLTAALANASCDKMLDPESDLIMYEEDNQLNTQNDTLYSVMGALHLMQQVADRSNLLGEVRADLVTLTADASLSLQDLANFENLDNNEYNRPMDYYAIINNCNYFIEHADSTYKKNGVSVFERELAVMHTYRAWAYLQLAQIYGKVPFYTHFIDSKEEAAEVRKQSTLDIKQICEALIPGLKPFQNTRRVVYPGTLYGYSIQEFTIPVKLMLGELCLWAEQYEEAAFWYHAFFTDENYLEPLGGTQIYWYASGNGRIGCIDGYSGTTGYISIIPMETNPLYGTISELNNLYCSTSENYNHYEIQYSKGLLELSQSQAYYTLIPNAVNPAIMDTVKVDGDNFDLASLNDPTAYGDLRLRSMVTERAYNNSQNASYLDKSITNYKHTNSDIILYRRSTLYLHYAEALNRAGFPTAAFAVLKYGLCAKNTLQHPIADPIAADERERAGDLIFFDENRFTEINTMGIHAMGCGEAYANPEYVIPQLATANDTMLWVEDRIVDEMALENMFEGKRFFDLVRVADRRGDVNYLAERVAARNGKNQFDAALYSKLQVRDNWFMPFK